MRDFFSEGVDFFSGGGGLGGGVSEGEWVGGGWDFGLRGWRFFSECGGFFSRGWWIFF